MSNQPQPGSKPPMPGLFGLLARQLGQIVKAIASPVHPPANANTLYRDCKIEERPLPEDPNVTLRRTVIDEVIVSKKKPQDEIP